MKYLSQRDPAWAEKKLGQSNSTLGRWGCTTTSISMLSDYFECYKSPLEIASNVNNYQDDLILWSHLAFDRMQFVKREKVRNDKGLQNALSGPDTAVILQVNNGAHWVVAARSHRTRDEYTIIDPWDGKKKNCLASYHNITGAAYFSRKAFTAPTEVYDDEYAANLAKREYPMFLQTEQHGELWYVHPDGTREYLPNGDAMLQFMKDHATGIDDANLNKIRIKK